MAIVTKEVLLQKINEYLPEGTEDLSILEDISDTFDDLTAKSQTDWKAKYQQTLEAYRTRFTQGEPGKNNPVPDPEPAHDEPKGPTSFADLFKPKE